MMYVSGRKIALSNNSCSPEKQRSTRRTDLPRSSLFPIINSQISFQNLNFLKSEEFLKSKYGVQHINVSGIHGGIQKKGPHFNNPLDTLFFPQINKILKYHLQKILQAINPFGSGFNLNINWSWQSMFSGCLGPTLFWVFSF